MNLIFLGTPEFAVPTLEAIVAAGHTVSLVVTQPDRPKGRKQELTPSPVKAAALRHAIPVFQPERIRQPEAQARLQELNPEAMVVVGYGQIIPQSIIDIAPLGIINVHASLLPELRGAAPIQWSIARGCTRTGVTTMRIDAGLDTGDILLEWETPIGPDETAPELSARLAAAGADLLSAPSPVFAPEPSSLVRRTMRAPLTRPSSKKKTGASTGATRPANSQSDSRLSTLARSAHLVPRPIAAPLALASGSAAFSEPIRGPAAGALIMSRAFSPSAETALLWNYSKYNSKAVKKCRRKYSPTAIV